MPRSRPLTHLLATCCVVGSLGCGEGLRDARWFERREAAVPRDDAGSARDDAGDPGEEVGPRRDAAGPGSDAPEGPLARECKTLDQSGGELAVPDARLVVPFKALSQAAQICLAQALPRRGGGIGPAWDVTIEGGSFGQQPTLEVTFRPPEGLRLDQVALAYLDRPPNVVWIYTVTERAAPTTLKAPINNLGKERASHVAVVLTCGAACLAPKTCTGGVCQ